MKQTSQLLRFSIPNHSRQRGHRDYFIGSHPKHSQKGQLEWWIPTPSICPKLHSIPHPYLKLNIFAENLPTHPKLLHKPHPCTPLPSLEVHPPHSSPNFKATTLLQSLVFSTPNCHNHFPSKALLKVVNFLTPNPAYFIGAHTLSHPTKYVLESPHKKSLCDFSILMATCVRIVKR